MKRHRTPAQRAAAYSREIDRRNQAGVRDLRAGETPSVGHVNAVPDTELVQTMCTLGMPYLNAMALCHNGQQRFLALKCWADVQDANKGDVAAKERVDLLRERFDTMRRDGLIKDLKGVRHNGQKRVITV